MYYIICSVFFFPFQPRKFKLNYATYGKRPEPGPEFSVFVGDLTSEVDDYQLHQFFLKKFPSCKGGKVVTDPFGNSKVSKSNSIEVMLLHVKSKREVSVLQSN